MKTEGWVLVGIIGLVCLALLGWSVIGLPTQYGTPGSAYPPTIGGQ
jgi:hypothetical protein